MHPKARHGRHCPILYPLWPSNLKSSDHSRSVTTVAQRCGLHEGILGRGKVGGSHSPTLTTQCNTLEKKKIQPRAKHSGSRTYPISPDKWPCYCQRARTHKHDNHAAQLILFGRPHTDPVADIWTDVSCFPLICLLSWVNNRLSLKFNKLSRQKNPCLLKLK